MFTFSLSAKGVWGVRRSFSVEDSPLYLVFSPILSYLGVVLHCPVLSCLPPVLKQRGHRALQGPGVAVYGFSVSLCTVGGQRQYWGGRQGAAQDTLTDRPVFVPSPPFMHTTDTVFSFSPLPALSCLALVLSLPFPLPPLLFFLFRAGWLALESASRVKMRGQDSRGSKSRLGQLRPLSQPPGHKKVEGGKNLKETQWNCTLNCMTKGKERTRNVLFLGSSSRLRSYFRCFFVEKRVSV